MGIPQEAYIHLKLKLGILETPCDTTFNQQLGQFFFFFKKKAPPPQPPQFLLHEVVTFLWEQFTNSS